MKTISLIKLADVFNRYIKASPLEDADEELILKPWERKRNLEPYREIAPQMTFDDLARFNLPNDFINEIFHLLPEKTKKRIIAREKEQEEKKKEKDKIKEVYEQYKKDTEQYRNSPEYKKNLEEMIKKERKQYLNDDDSPAVRSFLENDEKELKEERREQARKREEIRRYIDENYKKHNPNF